MLDKIHRVTWIAVWSIFLLTSCNSSLHSDAVAQHEKKYPDIRKKYVYQSILRVANIKGDPNYNKLIEDVRKITLYLPPRQDSTYQITELRPAIRQEGYEELIDVRSKDAQRISLWVREKDDMSHYLGLIDSETDDIIFEIDGTIHPEYLTAITMADESILTDLIKSGF